MIELLAAIALAAGAGGMAYWRQRDYRAGLWCDLIAAAAFWMAAATSAGAVARTILRGTVLMTEVHLLFLNPFFIASAAYLAFYGLSLAIARALGDGSRAKAR